MLIRIRSLLLHKYLYRRFIKSYANRNDEMFFLWCLVKEDDFGRHGWWRIER